MSAKQPTPARDVVEVDPARVQAITEAAEACFERWGISRTRMEDIAKESGIARPALYRYFASKEALVHAVIVRHINQRRRELHRSVPRRGPAGPLIVRALMHGITSERSLSESVLGGDAVHETARLVAESDTVFAAMAQYWRPYLEYAHQRGELAPGVDLDQAVRWLTLIVFYFLSVPEIVPDRRKLPEYLRTFVVNAIVPPPSS